MSKESTSEKPSFSDKLGKFVAGMILVSVGACVVAASARFIIWIFSV